MKYRYYEQIDTLQLCLNECNYELERTVRGNLFQVTAPLFAKEPLYKDEFGRGMVRRELSALRVL